MIRSITLTFFIFYFFISCQDNKVEKEKSEIYILSQKIDKNPNNKDFIYQRAQYNKQKNNLESALFDLKKCVELDSLNDIYHFELGNIYFELSKNSNAKPEYPFLAKNHLEKAIELNHQNFKYTALLGELFLSYTRYKESIKLFNHSLDISYNQPRIHMLMGYAFKQLGKEEQAIDCFRNSINIDPEFREAFVQLGNIFHLRKDTSAIIYYDNALKLDSNDEITLYNKALFYQDMMDWNNALDAYSELHKKSPFHSSGHYNLGFIHMELGLYDIATNNFSDAIYSNSEFFEAYYSRGICFQKLGNIKQAEIDFNRAIEINPNYTFAVDALENLMLDNKKFIRK